LEWAVEMWKLKTFGGKDRRAERIARVVEKVSKRDSLIFLYSTVQLLKNSKLMKS
jgi:hypothetical protein